GRARRAAWESSPGPRHPSRARPERRRSRIVSLPGHDPRHDRPEGIVPRRHPVQRMPPRVRHTLEAKTILGNRPDVEISPAAMLDDLRPGSVEQAESLRSEAPEIVRRTVDGIDEACCVDRDASRLQNTMAFIDRLLRVAL